MRRTFANRSGAFDPNDNLAVLYNTTQAVVGFRALGAAPLRSPLGVMDRFFADGAYRCLPWYTTSYFPLFYADLDAPFPFYYRDMPATHMIENQTADGYLGDLCGGGIPYGALLSALGWIYAWSRLNGGTGAKRPRSGGRSPAGLGSRHAGWRLKRNGRNTTAPH